MHVIVGIVVFVVGVGVLGWWGSTSHAPRMEDRVREAAASAKGATIHPVETTVSGRDIVVSGLANSEAERDAILDRLKMAEGRRVVRDELGVLKMAAPYILRAVKAEGSITLSGNTPTVAAQEDFATATGLGVDALEIAAGMPDAAWTGVGEAGVRAVGHLINGDFSLSGRDATLNGVAATPVEKARAMAELGALPAGYTLNDLVELEDDGTPMRVDMDINGTELFVGDSKLPKGMAADVLTSSVGLDAELDAVTLAKIAGPTEDWADFATAGATALGALDVGELRISGKKLSLIGNATRDGRATALQSLSSIGYAYDVSSDISLTDDGQPFSLNVTYDGDRVSSRGKVPFGTSADLAATTLGASAESTDMRVAEIDDEAGTWADAATTSLMALKNLTNGQLNIDDRDITLIGSATRQGRGAAENTLSALPGGYTVTQNVSLDDDGRPFQMVVNYDGASADATGKLPFGMDGVDLIAALGPNSTTDFDIAEIESENDAWPAAANSGLNALSKLQNGTLTIMGQDVTLRGTAVTPDNGTQIANLMQNMPSGFTSTTEFDYLDDGTAPSFDVKYSADRGAEVSGKLPAGLTAPDIAEALNLTSIESTATEGLTGAPDAATEALAKLSAWLPELTSVQLSTQDEDIKVAAVAAPGVDMELLEDGLSADFAGSVNVEGSSNLPAIGSERINALSGLREQFTGVAWVPIYDFAASVDVCQRQTINIMQNDPIGFVSGGSRLDAKSMRGINALAGLINHCNAGGDFAIDVAGHTDSQGSEDGNQRLSQARAQSVFAALIERGVDPEMMTATGFGESTPIADNGTEEGRAANRRTELVWSEASAANDETQGE